MRKLAHEMLLAHNDMQAQMQKQALFGPVSTVAALEPLMAKDVKPGTLPTEMAKGLGRGMVGELGGLMTGVPGMLLGLGAGAAISGGIQSPMVPLMGAIGGTLGYIPGAYMGYQASKAVIPDNRMSEREQAEEYLKGRAKKKKDEDMLDAASSQFAAKPTK